MPVTRTAAPLGARPTVLVRPADRTAPPARTRATRARRAGTGAPADVERAARTPAVQVTAPSAPSPSADSAAAAAPRVLLPVTLEGDADYLCAQRRALLRSPLGVHVSHIDAHRERMAVWFDLAHADLGFAIHTLLATVPDAMLGSLRRRAC